MHRRSVLQAGLALGAMSWISHAHACEVQLSTLRVRHPWTRATPLDAGVAVLGMTIDEVTEPDRLIGVRTLVAQGAQIAGRDAGAGTALDLAIPVGRETVLSDEGGVHIRLVGLRLPLHLGRVYPLTLFFEKGGVALTTLNVDYDPRS